MHSGLTFARANWQWQQHCLEYIRGGLGAAQRLVGMLDAPSEDAPEVFSIFSLRRQLAEGGPGHQNAAAKV